MSDPTFDHIDHGLESWDTIFNDNMDKIDANVVRSTKSADHGQKTYLDHAEAESPVLSGASYTFAGLVPAGCIHLGTSYRVTALVTGATSIDVGDGTTADLYGDNIAVALGTTGGLPEHKTAWAPTFRKTAGDVVLTANGSNFTAGKVRATVHFMKITPPTS